MISRGQPDGSHRFPRVRFFSSTEEVDGEVDTGQGDDYLSVLCIPRSSPSGRILNVYTRRVIKPIGGRDWLAFGSRRLLIVLPGRQAALWPAGGRGTGGGPRQSHSKRGQTFEFIARAESPPLINM